MERPKYLILALLLSCLPILMNGQDRMVIYEAYVTSNMTQWKAVIDRLENEPNKPLPVVLDLLEYEYGYVAWCMGKEYFGLASEFIKKAEKLINQLEHAHYQLSDVYAFKSAFFGFRMGINHYSAAYLGPKSLWYSQKSIESDSINPLSYIQAGNAKYYMPSVLGGSKTEALAHYQKACKLMEKSPKSIDKSWIYLNLLTIIARAHTDLGNYNSAKAQYEKILSLEPRFVWVKNSLYPELKKRMMQPGV